MRKLLLFTFSFVLMLGCGSKRKIVTKKSEVHKKKETVVLETLEENEGTPAEIPDEPDLPKKTYASATDEYIATYSEIALDNMRKYKIPASITLAQGILESGSGKGRLSVKANNHFGIKCHGWTGEKIYHDDDRKQECFRKYEYAKSSFEDHSQFLTRRGRYAKLFELKQDDYKGWAKGLRAAGYATDRKYPQKLISLIERYELYKYDDMVLKNKTVSTLESTSGTDVLQHKVEEGDTLYSLSKRYNTSVEDLKLRNNLKDNTINVGQILIIK
ncbi:MAG: glucosaminidase domain-containing protein [Bacteroidota bacterium]